MTKPNKEIILLPVIKLETHEAELRTPSEPVPIDEITTPEFQYFLDQLHESMLAEPLNPGWMHAGISAVQVNKHVNVFLAYNGNHDNYEVFINPEVKLMGNSTDVKDESCLSIPNDTGPVRRHKRVKVTFYDREGNKRKERYSGWNARVIQHEFDHLHGVLFIDKLED